MSAHADYFAIKRTSWSLLKCIDVSPAYFRYRERTPLEDSPTMRMGRAVHAAVLEPTEFPREFVLFDGTRRGKVWDEFAAVNADKTILTVEEYDRALGIAAAVKKNKDARRLLSRTKREQTATWTDAATNVKCKARVDAWKKGVVIDLKTTRTLDERRFTRLCHDFDYFGQLCFYTRGLQAQTDVWQQPWDWSQYVIGVEQEAPHDCGVFEVDEDSAWYAHQHVSELLALLAKCRKSRRWPGRYESIRTLSMPGWALAEKDAKEEAALTMVGAFRGDA